MASPLLTLLRSGVFSGGGVALPLSLVAPVNSSINSKGYHAFGFDRLVEGYNGNTVTLRRLTTNDTQSFSTNNVGALDRTEIDNWRAGEDVDVDEFIDQMERGAIGTPVDTVAFIRNNEYVFLGVDYEDENGDELDITNITQADPAVVTVAGHGLSTGDVVYLGTILGMLELNGSKQAITVIDNNTFSLNGVDSTAFTAYASGGYVSHQKRELLTRAQKGGVACNMAGVGAIRVSNTNMDVGANGLEIHYLGSHNKRRVTHPENDLWGGENVDQKILAYGFNATRISYEYFSTFGTFLFINAGAGDNAIGGLGKAQKANSQNLISIKISPTAVKWINSPSVLLERSKTLNATNNTAIASGVLDDGVLIIGAGMGAGETATTSQRADALFSGVIMTQELTPYENTMLRADLALIGQQHLNEDVDTIKGYFEERILHGVGANPSTGDVVAENGNVTLQYNTNGNTVFDHTDEITGIDGVRTFSNDANNNFIANNNYFGSNIKGSSFAMFRGETPNNQLTAVFTRDNHDGTSTLTNNRSWGHCRDHAIGTAFFQVAEERRKDNGVVQFLAGSRTFADDTNIGDALSNQETVKYDRNVALGSVSIPSVAFGYDNWTFDSLANRDPLAPHQFNAPVNIPTGQNISDSVFDGVLCLQVATADPSSDYDVNDTALDRKPHRLKSVNTLYQVAIGTPLGHTVGDIGINKRGLVPDPAPNSKLMSSNYFARFGGTTHAIGLEPVNIIAKENIEVFMANAHKMVRV